MAEILSSSVDDTQRNLLVSRGRSGASVDPGARRRRPHGAREARAEDERHPVLARREEVEEEPHAPAELDARSALRANEVEARGETLLDDEALERARSA